MAVALGGYLKLTDFKKEISISQLHDLSSIAKSKKQNLKFRRKIGVFRLNVFSSLLFVSYKNKKLNALF